MKLFQQLLLAPTALGLLAPVAANAADINIKDIAGYANKSTKQYRAVKSAQFSDVVPGDWAYTALQNLSESYGCVDNAYTQSLKSGQALTRYEAAALVNACLEGGVASAADNSDALRLTNEFGTEMAILKGRVDGLEYKVKELSAGQFSPTTKMTGKVVFNTGYVDDNNAAATDNKLSMSYVAQYNLYSSFTGEDKLYTRIKSGNMSGPFEDQAAGTHLSAANSNGNVVQIDKLWYEFPVTDSVKAWIGPRIENYYMLASSPSIYKPVTKQFALGGNASTYGSSTSPGVGLAWTQQTDNRSDARWAVSTNYAAISGAQATGGMFTDDSASKWLTKVEYGSPRWQVSAAMARNFCDENPVTGVDSVCTDWQSYYTTLAGETLTGDETAYALRAYWKPESTGAVPAIQVGFDWSSIDDDGLAGSVEKTQAYMVGLIWKDLFVDGNQAGVAFGTPQHATETVTNAALTDAAVDAFAWEAYYDYKVNDGITITPSIFSYSNRTDGTTGANDGFGGLVQTTFKF